MTVCARMSVCVRGLRRILPATWTKCLSTSVGRFNLDRTSDGQLCTIADVKQALIKMVGVRADWGDEPWQDPGNMQPVATSQAELPLRTPSDSMLRARIPLTDPDVRLKYLLYPDGVRFGRLLEDFDIVGATICYRHNLNPELGEDQKSPYAFVTVLVDRIERSIPKLILSSKKDIYLEGKITWVGKSSLECTMCMEQEMDGRLQQFLTARYLFAARNPLTNKAGVINPLDPVTLEEKAAFRLGDGNQKKRQVEDSKSLLKTPPSEEERLIIHNMFLSTLDRKESSLTDHMIKPENTVWMEDTLLRSLTATHPEQRNIFNKVFGGFLMRRAYELAWVTASIYSRKHPGMCRTVDDILFKKPVEIGALLFLTSQVVYTKGPDVQVHVLAEVLNPQEDTWETTNEVHFTFNTGKPNLPKIAPKSYAEAMRYLVGKRHYES